MTSHLLDWLSMLGRWAHIITGIAWIGSSFFFMWLDSHMADPEEGKIEGVEGELFMVHGGGYYRVHKKPFLLGQMPKVLHWFKWEAYTTWITGFFTLGVIYYAGGGTYMVDTGVADITGTQAILIGLFSLFGSWMIYDIIWRFLGHIKYLPMTLTAGLMFGMDIFLNNTLSGRAAYIHMGAMLGTWMVGNVFIHIIPKQRIILNAIENGQSPDQSLAKKAKQRSVHNNYFTLPVLFIMISNHHPMTYGHDQGWLILAIMFAAGAFIRHYFNMKNSGKDGRWAIYPAIFAIVVSVTLTIPITHKASENLKKFIYDDEKTIELGNSSVSGVIEFIGIPPVNKTLKMPAACANQYSEAPRDNLVLVNNGKLQNVVVWIKNPPKKEYPVPRKEIEIDQRGCIYIPRVSAARAGQSVTFINSDPIFHNVKTVSDANKRFNSSMPEQGQRITKVFNEVEFTVHAKCSLHPWMGAHMAIFDHPYFSVSDKDGKFKISKLPAGEYKLGVWHEVYGEKTINITVKDDENFTVNIPIDSRNKKE